MIQHTMLKEYIFVLLCAGAGAINEESNFSDVVIENGSTIDLQTALSNLDALFDTSFDPQLKEYFITGANKAWFAGEFDHYFKVCKSFLKDAEECRGKHLLEGEYRHFLPHYVLSDFDKAKIYPLLVKQFDIHICTPAELVLYLDAQKVRGNTGKST